MPVPMMAPIPRSVRSNALKLRRRALPPCSTSPTSCSIDFVLNRFESIPPPRGCFHLRAGATADKRTRSIGGGTSGWPRHYKGVLFEYAQESTAARFGIALQQIANHSDRRRSRIDHGDG